MAQAGYTPIQLYHSTTTTNVPSAADLLPGELAINTADGILFYEDSGGTVKPIAHNITPVANGGTGVTTSTGTGSVVLSTSPTLVTPALGTPTSGTLSSCTVDGTNAVGFKNIPAIADKTTSYSLQTADVGKVVGVGSGGSITVPNSTFAAGDAVLVFNNTAGDITITCSITTAYISGTDDDKATVTLATRGLANILFVSGTVCVISGNVS
jgi:hypothetical protein